jgi:hypothetical protein
MIGEDEEVAEEVHNPRSVGVALGWVTVKVDPVVECWVD